MCIHSACVAAGLCRTGSGNFACGLDVHLHARWRAWRRRRRRWFRRWCRWDLWRLIGQNDANGIGDGCRRWQAGSWSSVWRMTRAGVCRRHAWMFFCVVGHRIGWRRLWRLKVVCRHRACRVPGREHEDVVVLEAEALFGDGRIIQGRFRWWRRLHRGRNADSWSDGCVRWRRARLCRWR